MQTQWTITFSPTKESPRGTHRFDMDAHGLADARQRAQLYLMHYPERRQVADIIRHQRLERVTP